MNNSIKLIATLFTVLSLIACTEKNSTKVDNNSNVKSEKMEEYIDHAHNSMNSLDWDGVYVGMLPCADCEAIKTILTLYKDKTYKLEMLYKGKSEEVFSERGVFQWSEDGSKITLDNENKTTYHVGENRITQLDKSGNTMEGDLSDKYVLSKANPGLTGIYWKLFEIQGREVTFDTKVNSPAHVILLEGEGRIAGSGSCNRLMGGYTQDKDNQLTFSQVATTMMACPDMELEQQFLKMLEKVDSYAIKESVLSLHKAKMAPLARFEAEYMLSPKFD